MRWVTELKRMEDKGGGGTEGLWAQTLNGNVGLK